MKSSENSDFEVLRAFIGAAITQGVHGYRADYLLPCLFRMKNRIDELEKAIEQAVEDDNINHLASTGIPAHYWRGT